MSNKEDEKVKFLDEYNPIIEQQSLTDTDIYILGENPKFGEKSEIEVKESKVKYPLRTGTKKLFEKINKNKETAKKFPNKIFLGTDSNYYVSKKNKKGDYVWMLLQKK